MITCISDKVLPLGSPIQYIFKTKKQKLLSSRCILLSKTKMCALFLFYFVIRTNKKIQIFLIHRMGDSI